ncbi:MULTISPECIES: hypothetical protein [Bacillus]|nr:hypothetical protein [Bacillus cereus]
MCWVGMLFRGNGFWYDTTGVILLYVSEIQSMRKYKKMFLQLEATGV